MFVILKQIIDMQTNQLKELPTKVDKDAIGKEYAFNNITFKGIMINNILSGMHS